MKKRLLASLLSLCLLIGLLPTVALAAEPAAGERPVTVADIPADYIGSVKKVEASWLEGGRLQVNVTYQSGVTNAMAGIAITYKDAEDNDVSVPAYAQEYMLDGEAKTVLTSNNVPAEWDWSKIHSDCTIYYSAMPTSTIGDALPLDAADIRVSVDGLTFWSYNNGALSITGSGNMADFTTTSGTGHPDGVDETAGKGSRIASFPWHKEQLNIASLTFDNAITGIGIQAFRKHVNLANVTFPTRLVTLGRYSLGECSSLSNADLSSCTSLAVVENNALIKMASRSTITVAGLDQYVLFLASDRYTAGANETTVTYNGLVPLSEGDWSGVKLSNDSCIVTAYSGSGGAVVIPATLEGVPVVRLANGLLQANTSITVVSFKEGSVLTTIPANFLSRSSNVTSIDLPDSITALGNVAFSMYSTKPVTITLNSQKLESVGDYAFANVQTGSSASLALTFSDALKSLGSNAFRNTAHSITFTAGDYGALAVDPAAFELFNGNVTFKAGATNINSLLEAFVYVGANYRARSDTIKVYQNESAYVEYRADYDARTVTITYVGCDIHEPRPAEWYGLAVENVYDRIVTDTFVYDVDTVKQEVKVVGYNGALPATLEIPAKYEGLPIVAIGPGAFENMGSKDDATLQALTFEEGSKCKVIEKNAFKNQNKLTTITLADSITNIKQNAFQLDISHSSSAERTLHLPASLETLGASSFYLNLYNQNTAVELPDKLTSIGNHAFRLSIASFTALSKELDLGYCVFSTTGSRTFIDLSRVENLTVANNSETETNDHYSFMAKYIYLRDVAALNAIKASGRDTMTGIYGITNGGTVTATTSDTGLVTPTKLGYDFGGWFENAECTGEAVTTFSESTTYYAKWTPKTAVNNTASDRTHTFGTTFDVSTLFTPDTNAGDASYEIVTGQDGSTGEGTLNGSTLTITKAGTIVIKLTTAGTETHAPGTATATLTVNKATYDMSGVKFENGTFTYDGTEKKIEITGTLPEGVTVAYENNAKTDAGTYTAVAKFTIADTTNYNAIENMTATLTINKADPQLTISANKTSFTGSGTVKLTVEDVPAEGSVTVSCPDATVTQNQDGTWSASLPNTTKTYTFTATYEATANYNEKAVTCEIAVTRYTYDGPAVYTIAKVLPENGTLIATPSAASKGTDVKITVKPDEGYELDTLTVITTGTKKEIALTDLGNGKYTFEMPAAGVTVTATFKEIPAIVFVDVPESEYYYDAVYWAVANGVTNGKGSTTTFKPLDTCTRAEAVTFLWRAAGSPEPETTDNPFIDVPESEYYYKAVLWAVENGITLGTSTTTFSPNNECDRGTIVTFIYRMVGEPAVTGNGFADVPDGAYYADATIWAVQNGVTNGTNDDGTTFTPLRSCMRAEIVTFLYRHFVK